VNAIGDDMNPDFLINGVLQSVMGGGGRKQSRRALRYLTGGHGSFWTSPTTLLTAAGLAWGVYDTLKDKTDPNSQWGGGAAPQTGPQSAGPAIPAVASMPATPLPPLPNIGAPAAPGGVDQEALRLIRLAVSAANADGVMNEQERAAVLQQAQAAGVADIVERELQQRTPLADIVAGVSDPGQRATMYVLAFTVLRADEQLTGAERIYLAQLAHLLGLDPATVQRLEKDTGERIDALGDQGQLGG
jgi:uncharacterized membrane protein YebE (DUF533 family)